LFVGEVGELGADFGLLGGVEFGGGLYLCSEEAAAFIEEDIEQLGDFVEQGEAAFVAEN